MFSFPVSSSSLASLSLMDEDVPNNSFSGQNTTLVPPASDLDVKGRPLPKNISFVSTDTSDDVILKPQLSKGIFSDLYCIEMDFVELIFKAYFLGWLFLDNPFKVRFH